MAEPDPRRATAHPTAPEYPVREAHARERAEIQTAMLRTFAHELSNTSTPVELVAHSIVIAPTAERSVAAGKTLQSVAGRLSQLIAIARIIADDTGGQSGGPQTGSIAWIEAFAPFVESEFPNGLAMEVACDDMLLPGSLLSPLAWSLVGSAMYLSEVSPTATGATLRLTREDAGECLRVELSSTGARAPDKTQARWLAFTTSVVEASGGAFRLRRSALLTTCTSSFPLHARHAWPVPELE